MKELEDPGRRAQVAAACRDWAGQLSWQRATDRMAEMVEACLRLGSSRGSRAGAWVVCGPESGDTVAEGPVLDLLVASGGVITRPAAPAERLIGTASGDVPGEVSTIPSPVDSVMPR